MQPASPALLIRGGIVARWADRVKASTDTNGPTMAAMLAAPGATQSGEARRMPCDKFKNQNKNPNDLAGVRFRHSCWSFDFEPSGTYFACLRLFTIDLKSFS